MRKVAVGEGTEAKEDGGVEERGECKEAKENGQCAA